MIVVLGRGWPCLARPSLLGVEETRGACARGGVSRTAWTRAWAGAQQVVKKMHRAPGARTVNRSLSGVLTADKEHTNTRGRF